MQTRSGKSGGATCPGRSSAGTVLVVEDNAFSRRVATILLTQLDYAVHIARNGLEALEAVKQNSYSFILMDCHMPEMDGLEATVAIRQREMAVGGHVPIFGFSASVEPEACLAAGMDANIGKPIDPDNLKKTIKQLAPQAGGSFLSRDLQSV